MKTSFRHRAEAGQCLAEKLTHHAGRADLIVLGLPRGGVPVAFEVAARLHAPLDVFIVRKLGVPGHEELAMGAIASGGTLVLNHDVIQHIQHASAAVEEVMAKESAEITRREREYRGQRPAPDLRGRVVILVDDGLATGATMRAAVTALRKQAVARLVVAVPVGVPESCAAIEQEVDEFICLLTPENFRCVGQYYEDFSQTTDDEVRECLASAAGLHANA
ncbi:MAG: phosphoribosyl transferase [Chthoniobacter sp. 12-60-6]|nr:MAG: phosphoribosyl transferase [Chthoniobacter sp. 12-60-6]